MDISKSSSTQPGAIRDQHQVESLGQAARKVSGKTGRRQTADEVVISDQARLLQKLSKAVRDTPDVRQEKVAELREAIRQGRYEVSPAEIAKALLASRTK